MAQEVKRLAAKPEDLSFNSPDPQGRRTADTCRLLSDLHVPEIPALGSGKGQKSSLATQQVRGRVLDFTRPCPKREEKRKCLQRISTKTSETPSGF